MHMHRAPYASSLRPKRRKDRKTHDDEEKALKHTPIAEVVRGRKPVDDHGQATDNTAETHKNSNERHMLPPFLISLVCI